MLLTSSSSPNEKPLIFDEFQCDSSSSKEAITKVNKEQEEPQTSYSSYQAPAGVVVSYS